MYNCDAHPEAPVTVRPLQARHVEVICPQCPGTAVIPDRSPECADPFHAHDCPTCGTVHCSECGHLYSLYDEPCPRCSDGSAKEQATYSFLKHYVLSPRDEEMLFGEWDIDALFPLKPGPMMIFESTPHPPGARDPWVQAMPRSIRYEEDISSALGLSGAPGWDLLVERVRQLRLAADGAR